MTYGPGPGNLGDAPAPAGPFVCERCGRALGPADLACPNCGALLYRARLEQLSGEALRLESVDPIRAVGLWRQCLALLPPDAHQHRMIADRVAALSGGAFHAGGYAGHPAAAGGGRQVLGYRPRGAEQAGPAETWQSVLLKTGGSMAFSVWLYSQMAGGWAFAVGLVLLIFVHEMGHVVANWYYGIRQSAPIFLGIFGAVIFVKGRIRSAWEEAVMGIAGPVFGTVAALGCYAWFLQTRDPLAGQLAFYGLFLNAWNLLPIPPLDGGRAAAAITPWLWPVGILGMVAVIGQDLLRTARSGGGRDLIWVFLLFWILRQSWSRVSQTLFQSGWRDPYYRVGWLPRVGMIALYAGLLVVLLGCMGYLVYLRDGIAM